MSVEWRTHITQAVRGLLENPNEPVSELSYFDCIESVMENSKVTGDGGGGPWCLFRSDYLSCVLKLSGTCAAARLAIHFTCPPVSSGPRRVDGWHFPALQDGRRGGLRGERRRRLQSPLRADGGRGPGELQLA